MENTAFKAYLELLRELTKILGQLDGLAHRKLEHVRADNVQGVDDCIRQEQVLSLSLRGLEKRRDAALKAMGLERVPLSGLVSHAPEELRTEALEVTNALRDQYGLYQSASEAARSALERVLHQVDRMVAAEQQGAAPHPAGARRNPREPSAPEPPAGGHGADFKA